MKGAAERDGLYSIHESEWGKTPAIIELPLFRGQPLFTEQVLLYIHILQYQKLGSTAIEKKCTCLQESLNR